MRWTKLAGIAAAALSLAGCAYGYRRTTLAMRYDAGARPDASYYCYDCHGYRFFDPYYDYCPRYSFQYRWSRHPEAVSVYRERYVRIKKSHPDYGRYRYSDDYRADPRYKEPREYQSPQGKPEPPVKKVRKHRDREQDRGDEGSDKKHRQGDQGKGPRDSRSRSTLPGGGS